MVLIFISRTCLCNSNTPLMVAAAHGYDDVAAILVAAGADVNAIGRIGNTALIYAAQSGHAEVVRVLIDSDASVDVENEFGNDAGGLARSYGFAGILDLIDSTGEQVADARPMLAF